MRRLTKFIKGMFCIKKEENRGTEKKIMELLVDAYRAESIKENF